MVLKQRYSVWHSAEQLIEMLEQGEIAENLEKEFDKRFPALCPFFSRPCPLRNEEVEKNA